MYKIQLTNCLKRTVPILALGEILVLMDFHPLHGAGISETFKPSHAGYETGKALSRRADFNTDSVHLKRFQFMHPYSLWHYQGHTLAVISIYACGEYHDPSFPGCHLFTFSIEMLSDSHQGTTGARSHHRRPA